MPLLVQASSRSQSHFILLPTGLAWLPILFLLAPPKGLLNHKKQTETGVRCTMTDSEQPRKQEEDQIPET